MYTCVKLETLNDNDKMRDRQSWIENVTVVQRAFGSSFLLSVIVYKKYILDLLLFVGKIIIIIFFK